MASTIAASVAQARPAVAQRAASKQRVSACAGFKAAPLAKKAASINAVVADRVAAVKVSRRAHGGWVGPAPRLDLSSPRIAPAPPSLLGRNAPRWRAHPAGPSAYLPLPTGRSPGAAASGR